MQKGTEIFQFSYLLDKAAECTNSLEQMVYVAALDVAIQSLLIDRPAKPFCPLLNQTFEFDRTKDLGWRIISEYYGHFPPTLCAVNLFLIKIKMFISEKRKPNIHIKN